MKFSIVIPGASRNQYSEKGDLERFGETSLLEWKISQACEFTDKSSIYVSTYDNLIEELVKDLGLQVLKRDVSDDLATVYTKAATALPDSALVLLNPTAPFLGGDVVQGMMREFAQLPSSEATIVSAFEVSDYLFTDVGPLNFERNLKAFSRSEIRRTWKITNGAYIATPSSVIKNGRFFSDSPHFYPIPWLASLEIRDSVQMSIYPNLIAMYFAGMR